jgi:Carboxypeptidase regulatory-like domain
LIARLEEYMNSIKKFAILVLWVSLAATILSAQGKSELRTVRGTVVDGKEAPIDAAVVYLKNGQTQDVTTHISDNQGLFRFTGLDPNIDYQLHAEKDGLTSNARSISNFETRKELVMTLKVDHKKNEK